MRSMSPMAKNRNRPIRHARRIESGSEGGLVGAVARGGGIESGRHERILEWAAVGLARAVGLEPVDHAG